jgi:hypothetical protein
LYGEGWKEVPSKPVVHRKNGLIGPKALSHHTITVVGHHGYLFGGSMGVDSNSKFFRLNLNQM